MKFNIIILMFIVLSAVSIGSQSGDITNIAKNYTPDNKTAIINNGLLNLTLVENTYQCSESCYAIMKFDIGSPLAFPSAENNLFKFDFQNLKSLAYSNLPHNFEISYGLINVTQLVGDNCTYDKDTNKTVSCNNITRTIQDYNFTSWDYKSKSLPKGTYYIKINGYKKWNESLDWVMTIANTSIDKWAKWTTVSAFANFTFDDGTSNTTMGANTGTGAFGDLNLANGVSSVSTGTIDSNAIQTNVLGGLPTYNTQQTVGGWSLWIKTTINSSLDDSFCFIQDDPGGNNAGDFSGGFGCQGYGTIGYFNVNWNKGSGTLDVKSTTSNFIKGKWYHIFFKLNLTGAYLYVNGVLENSVATSNTPAYFGTQSSWGMFRDTGTTSTINATFDEVKFFNVDLSDAQIIDINNTESTTVAGDTTPPVVTLNSPTNNKIYNTSTITFNFSLNENGSCFYSLDAGINNVSMTNINNVQFNYTNASVGDKNYLTSIYCNDTAGNKNYTATSNFSVDTTFPQIKTIIPSANNLFVNWQTDVNYTISDAHLQACWWTNNTGISNHSLTCGANITGITWKEGLNNITIYANDSVGNTNSTYRNFTLDTVLPLITIIYPTNTTYNINVSTLNYTITDVNPDSCWWTNNTGSYNSSKAVAGANFTNVKTQQGGNIFKVYCNDSANNLNISNSITFSEDYTNPNATLISPANGSIVTNQTQNFTANISDNIGIKNATLNIYSNTLGLEWCYQETANDSTLNDGNCGLNYTGNYSNDGNWGTTGTFAKTYDGDWGTAGFSEGSPFVAYGYVTYRKPANAFNTSLWQIEGYIEGSIIMVNLTILQSCWTYDSNFLNFRYISGYIPAYNEWDCYDGSWEQLAKYTGTTNYRVVAEEAMVWLVNITTTQSTLINQTTTTFPSGTTQTLLGIVVTLADGIYKWFYNIFDWGGNQYVTNNNTLTIDSTPPNINLVNPTETNNSYLKRSNIEVNVTASDGNTGLKNVTIYLYNSTSFVNSWSLGNNLSDGLVGYYKLDINSTSQLDSSSYSNNGSVFNTPYFTNYGKFNGAYYFDSNSSAINITRSSDSLNFSCRSLSISAWINTTDDRTDIGIIGTSNGTDRDFNLIYKSAQVGGDEYITFRTFNSSGNDSILNSSIKIINSSWTHIVAIYNYDTSMKYIYVDGVLTNSQAFFGCLRPPLTSDEIRIGHAINNNFFNGTIDEVRIYNRSLTSLEVTELYSSLSPFYKNITGLSDGTYYINASAYDTAGNKNYTDTRKVTLDNVNPLLNIVFPATNNLIYNYNVNVNFTAIDTNLASCWWTNNSGISNHTLTCGNNVTNIVWNTGLNNVTIYINDSVGNMNSSYRNFTILNYGVNITLLSPANNSYNFTTTQNFTANITDKIDLTNATLYVYNSTALYNSTFKTLSTTSINEGIVISNLPNDNYTWFYRGSDTMGVEGTSVNYSLVIDTIYPIISYGTGTEDSGVNLSQSNIYINTTWTETNFKNITFLVWNLTYINPQSSNTPIYAYNFTSLLNGHYYYNATICDKVNYCNTTETREITIDAVPPVVQQGYTNGGGGYSVGVNNSYQRNATVNFTANVTDIIGIENVTITVTNGTGGIVNQTTRSFFGNVIHTLVGIPIVLIDGIYHFVISAYDTASNFITSSIMDLIVNTSPGNFTSSNYTLVWQDNNTYLYKLNTTIIEVIPNQTNIEFNGVNYSAYNLTNTLFEFNFTKTITSVPYIASYYWWLLDNNSNFQRSDDYIFNITCPIGYKTFNNSLCVEDLNYLTNDNITRYLTIPNIITGLITGYIRLSGNSSTILINNYNCTQGINNLCSGNSPSTTTASNYADYNYKKPIGVRQDNTLWNVKHGTLNYNITISSDCWNYNSTDLFLRIYGWSDPIGTGFAQSYPSCYNGTDWKIIGSTDSGYATAVGSGAGCPYMWDNDFSTFRILADLGGGYLCYDDSGGANYAGRIYEQQIFWNIDNYSTNYPTNPSLTIGSTHVWNYTSIFNQTNNRTNNLASTISKYLNSTYLVGSNYLIPFTFHSDTIGILRYYDMEYSDVGIIDNGVTYASPVIEGQNNIITGNFTSPQIPTSITINYNGINSTPSITAYGNIYILTSNLTTPIVSSNTNISFYYTFIINNTAFISEQRNQTITTISISTNCSAGNYLFLNLTNYDEENLNIMNGTVDYILSLQSDSNEISFLNGTATGENLLLCSNQNLSNSYLNYILQLRYYASDYLYKTYNIQNSPVSNMPLSINLYYLNNTIGTPFKINYVDFNYLSYPGAIMQIQRQYLTTNSYNVVEIPKLDNNGRAIASFNTNNIRYKIIVINNGVILDIFSDIFPVCQNAVLGTCELNLRGAKSTTSSTNDDFTYTLKKSNDTLTLTYIIPSGTPRNIQFLTVQNSRFMDNITSCNSSIFASGGTINCAYNETIGDSIISTQIINSDGSHLYGSVLISENLSGFYLLNNYFIGFVLILTLGLMFVSSGAFLVIVSVIGLIFLGLIFLIRGMDVITLTGSLGWLIIGAIIIIYKISQKEETT